MARQTSFHPLVGSVPALHHEQAAAPRFAAWILVAREVALNAAGRRPPPSAA